MASPAQQLAVEAGCDAAQPSQSGRPPSAPQPAGAAAPSTSGGSGGGGGANLDGVIEAFQRGAVDFQEVLSGLVAGVLKEREELAAARTQLEAERDALHEEAERVMQVYNDSEQVTLNVGGHKFTTTIATLRLAPAPSLFNAMFSGRHVLKVDESGCYFLDRDGRHFHDILNYLRDGQFNYPVEGADYKYLIELRAEAEYYGLTGLLNQIDRFPYNMTRVHRASIMNLQDNWMYEDGQDEVVFTVDKDCQLIGVGLCATEGAFTVELVLVEVDPEDFNLEVAKVAEAAQSFTRNEMNEQQIVRLMLELPVRLQHEKHYMISALIKGSESFCCEECLEVVVAAGVRVTFKPWESPNGTTNDRGQFPELYIRAL